MFVRKDFVYLNFSLMINFRVWVRTSLWVWCYVKRAKSEEELIKKMWKKDFKNLINVDNMDKTEDNNI